MMVASIKQIGECFVGFLARTATLTSEVRSFHFFIISFERYIFYELTDHSTDKDSRSQDLFKGCLLCLVPLWRGVN